MPGIEKQRIPTHVATTPYGNPTTTDILGDVPIYYTTDAQGNLIPVKPAEIQNAATNLTPNGIDLRNIGNGAFLYAGSQFYDLGTGNGVLEVFDIKSLLAGPGLSITEDDKTVTINTEWKYLHFPLNAIIGMPDTIEANSLLFADWTGNFQWIPHGNAYTGLIWNGSGYDWFDWSCARDICYPWPNGTTVLTGYEDGVRVYGELCLFGRNGELTDVCLYGDDGSLIIEAGSLVLPYGALTNRPQPRIGSLYYNLTSKTLQIGTADGWRDISYSEKPEANVIYVGKNGSDDNLGTSPEQQLLTIGAACRLADALNQSGLAESNATVIKVFAGIYWEPETVYVPTGVTLVGDDRGAVTIRCSDNVSTVVRLGFNSSLSNVTVSGPYYTEQNILDDIQDGWAVKSDGGSTVTSCIINSFYCYYSESPANYIYDSHINCFGAIGIKVSGSGTVNVHNTSVHNAKSAFLATKGGYVVCVGCSASYGEYALWADGSNDESVPSRIEGNWFTFNYVGVGVNAVQLPATRGGVLVSDKSKYKNETGDQVKGIVTFAQVDEYGMLSQFQQMQMNMGALLPLLLLKKRK